jgi:hypothetical protein
VSVENVLTNCILTDNDTDVSYVIKYYTMKVQRSCNTAPFLASALNGYELSASILAALYPGKSPSSY